MKQYEILVLVGIALVLLATPVSAWEFGIDDYKDYNPSTKVVSFYDTSIFGDDTKLADIYLVNYTETDSRGQVCFVGDCWMYNDWDIKYGGIEVLKSAIVYDKEQTSEKSGRNLEYQIWDENAAYDVPTYKQECKLETNKTTDKEEEVCNSVFDKNITQYGKWIPFTTDIKPTNGYYHTRQRVDVRSGETIDYVPNYYGFEVKEWADFTGMVRYEYQITSNNGVEIAASADGYAWQTFTIGAAGANVNQIVKGLEIKIQSLADDTYTIYYHIYESAANKTSCYQNVSYGDGYLSTAITGSNWYNITGRSNATLTAGGLYCLYVNSSAVDRSKMLWNDYRAGGAYSGGQEGSHYANNPNYDTAFALWGVENAIYPVPSIIYPTNTTYNSAQSLLNYSAPNGVDCWYTRDGGITNSTSVACGVNFTSVTSNEGTNNWTIWANSSTATKNYTTKTFTIDTIFPANKILHPTNLSYVFNYTEINTTTQDLNFSASDANIDSCWVYNVTSGANKTLTCGANTTMKLGFGSQRFYTYVNDSVNHVNTSYVDATFSFRIKNISQSWANYAYETQNITLTQGIEYDNNTESSISATLWYNGTAYSTTATGSGALKNFTAYVQIPAITTNTTKNLFWEYVLSATTSINGTAYTQQVGNISFDLCPNAGNDTFINFTFKNEADNSALNGQIDNAAWNYWLGTPLYATSSAANATAQASIAYCFQPTDKTVYYNTSLAYSATGYPQRRYAVTSGSLTTADTDKVLYLLATADGQYVTYVVVTSTGSPISGVDVTAERQISSIWTVIEQGYTGSDGAVTFWLNPDADHRITFTKTGYSQVIVSHRPTQTQYTVTMSTNGSSAEYTNKSFEGLKWKTYPTYGILTANMTYTFGFNITASLGNMVACRMELMNETTVLSTTTGCSAYGGNISTSFNVTDRHELYGRYSVDVGSGYFYLEQDGNWRLLTINASGNTIKDFWTSFKDLEEFGEDTDRQEFTRIIGFFIVFFIVLATISYTTQMDLSSPGKNLLIFAPMVIIASYGGFLTINMFAPSNTFVAREVLEQWYLGFIAFLISVGFVCHTWRKDSLS